MPARFSQVDDHLFRGGAPEPDELPILKDVWGIRKIVSLDESSGKRIADACKQLGLKHEILPLTDGNDKGFEEIPKKALEWAADDGATYVHCRHGKDRTGASCAIYRVLANGWEPDDALAEAASFGMGWRVSKEARRSFYDVVKKCVKQHERDSNSSSDIVTTHRDLLEEKQPIPAPTTFNPLSSAFIGSDGDSALPGQQSFAPFLDVENDHLNRPSSNRMKALLRLAATRLYRFCRPSDILIYNTLWATSPQHAMEQSQTNLPDWQMSDAKLFSAVVSDHAEVISFPQEPTKTLIHVAMLKEADVVWFKPPSGFDQYLIIDPSVISDIKEVSADTNDAPLVGLHDNYEGTASWVFPGGGTGMVPGLAGGAGGFAGFVQVPGEQF